MKRYALILAVAVSLIPLAASAALLGTLAIGGYAYNGGEQTNEANTISNALSAYGANGGVTGGSSYRNSYYQFRATGGYYFTLNGGNLGSNITIVHKRDWIGVATNICASWGSGWNDGQNVNDSNCNYYATWGRYDRTLGLNSPPPPSAPSGISASCPSPGTSATISWGSVSGSGITYALRADRDPSSWNGSCNPSSGSGDYCQDNLTSTSRSITTSPGRTYQMWVHAVNSSGWSNATLGYFVCVDYSTPPPCPSGTTGTYPNCLSNCSYTGTVQWSNCSKYYSGTVSSGSSVTLQNSASGYSGSATYSCSNGTWNTGNTSCVAVVNGSCSSSHYNCNAGNSNNQSSNSTTWTWSCQGSGGGSTASCSEQKPVNGSCSSSHYNCNAGSSTNNQNNSTTWTWRCNGTAGGSDASCSESKPLSTYTITASAGSGGSISPSGSVSVTQGNNQGFSINPSGGYNISAVTVDGGNAGAVSSYTFSNVQGNHTISASFAPANAAPNAPTISGPASGNPNTSYTYSVSATDPQGDQIRYGIDWSEPADGVADVWLPAGVNYVNSGTSQSTAHSWTTAGTHTFRALAQDTPGLNSGWTTYSVTLASCTPSYSCSGNDLYYTNASCVQSLSEACSYGCSGSACVPPPSLGFTPFSATNPLGNFTATGHLEMKPSLLRSGDTTWLYWNVANAQSCTATGTNGDSWSGASSGSAGKTSSAITSQTTYTLLCTGLAGSFPASTSETQTVNLIPVFEEQ